MKGTFLKKNVLNSSWTLQLKSLFIMNSWHIDLQCRSHLSSTSKKDNTNWTPHLTSRFMYWRHHSWTLTVATWRHLMPTYTDSLCVIHKKWFLRLIWLLMKYSLKSTQVLSSNIKSRCCKKRISPMNNTLMFLVIFWKCFKVTEFLHVTFDY